MTTKLKEVDVVIVGLGWTGGILAKELTEAGMKVVALERGGMRTSERFCASGVSRRLSAVVTAAAAAGVCLPASASRPACASNSCYIELRRDTCPEAVSSDGGGCPGPG